VREWLAKAEEDLSAAEAIVAATMPGFGTASFHAQQCAEKAIKALLVRHAVPFGKTHDIGRLLALAEPAAAGIAESLADAEALTPHGVATRYPMLMPGPDREAATRHLALAQRVCDEVLERLRGYLELEPSAT
jgi:HEPN domain-containing protein